MVTQTYQQAAWAFMDQALDELLGGDVVQASEKGWGAASQMVKAIAEARGWQHRSHVSLFSAVDRIARETGQPEIRRLFDVASSLHVNFMRTGNQQKTCRAGWKTYVASWSRYRRCLDDEQQNKGASALLRGPSLNWRPALSSFAGLCFCDLDVRAVNAH